MDCSGFGHVAKIVHGMIFLWRFCFIFCLFALKPEDLQLLCNLHPVFITRRHFCGSVIVKTKLLRFTTKAKFKKCTYFIFW